MLAQAQRLICRRLGLDPEGGADAAALQKRYEATVAGQFSPDQLLALKDLATTASLRSDAASGELAA